MRSILTLGISMTTLPFACGAAFMASFRLHGGLGLFPDPACIPELAPAAAYLDALAKTIAFTADFAPVLPFNSLMSLMG